jgi:hypothetical protein
MSRKSKPQESHEDRLLFENAELHDRIARGKNELRVLEIKLARLTRAGAAMYKDLIANHIITQGTNEWEHAAK